MVDTAHYAWSTRHRSMMNAVQRYNEHSTEVWWTHHRGMIDAAQRYDRRCTEVAETNLQTIHYCVWCCVLVSSSATCPYRTCWAARTGRTLNSMSQWRMTPPTSWQKTSYDSRKRVLRNSSSKPEVFSFFVSKTVFFTLSQNRFFSYVIMCAQFDIVNFDSFLR